MQDPASMQEKLTVAEKRRLWIFAGAGFFISPGAWLLQVMISETLAAQSCDTTVPLRSPGVPHMQAWLYGVSASALLVSIACATVATHGFMLLQRKHQRIRKSTSKKRSNEKPPREQEEVSRKRFIALCSALIGCLFVLALVFTILAEVFLASCSQWH
ncbi:hypothetical protein QCE63_35065 [Caballeronia sp. LZ065]|uniref:hypothetical protein n=1 Tax=Caballeronia sp. LZ065 TaxID=3038571 RepID=UPI00285EBC65|nr:hypothetical protein [Caballeronia sp. LZ065]MDR5784618.1 hypothetical protein [Caballeronia sp. LZ065]